MLLYDTIGNMDGLQKTHMDAVLRVLHERLLRVEDAASLSDQLEGEQAQARRAAVLVPMFEGNGEVMLAFIRRSTTLRAHSGEIAFPGGKAEPGELFPLETALREAEEEIGLATEAVEVLGLLPPIFTVVSNYLITPVVAFLPHGLGELRLQTSEVAEVLVAPLRRLADPAIAHTEQWVRDGRVRTVYFYKYDAYQIWGATGRMLAVLLELVKDV